MMKRMPRIIVQVLQIQNIDTSGKKHASNNETDKNRNQDNRLQSSEMHELRQPSTPFGVTNVTLDDTIIINENRQEADYHNDTLKTWVQIMLSFQQKWQLREEIMSPNMTCFL